MTEQQWLSLNDPVRMLEFLRGSNPLVDECPTPPPSDRKLRLFACACCRLLWDHLTFAAQQRVIDLEAAVDGIIPRHPLLDLNPMDLAIQEASVLPGASSPRRDELFASLVSDIFGNPFRSVKLPRSVIGYGSCLPASITASLAKTPIYGKCPWLAWNDRVIPRLAQQIYDSRDFSHMPVLADALEEAGCTNEEILMHARNGGVHVRGCWVIDLLLGKE